MLCIKEGGRVMAWNYTIKDREVEVKYLFKEALAVRTDHQRNPGRKGRYRYHQLSIGY